MGRVWLAQDVKLDRQVAVKEIIPPKGLTERERTETRLRTLREARTAASLSHPNVVRVFDTMNIDDQPWIVMEYVPSRSLQDVIDTDGPLPPWRVADIGLSVLAALRTAHKAGVLHRDVKPGNVLLADDGRVVLTDFGLATFDGDPQVTRTGMILGSPQYISPERASEGISSPESDLWSFGATLYAAVEGRAPYARPNALATLTALVTEDPDPSPRAGPLQPTLDLLLRRDPARRPAAEVVERLLRRVVAKASPADARMAALRQPTAARPIVVLSPASALRQPTGARPIVPTTPPTEVISSEVRRVSSSANDATQVAGSPGTPAGEPMTAPLEANRLPQQREAAETTLLGQQASGPPRGSVWSSSGRSTVAEPKFVLAGAWHKNPNIRYILIIVITVAIIVVIVVVALTRSSDTDNSVGSPGTSGSVSISATASGSSPSTDASTSTAFTLPAGWEWHDESGFRVATPQGWSRSTTSDGIKYSDSANGRSVIFSTLDMPDGTMLDEWNSRVSWRSNHSNYQNIKMETVPGYFLDCADWEYSYTNSSGEAVHVLDRGFVASGSQTYEIFWLTIESQWANSTGILDQMMQSFELA